MLRARTGIAYGGPETFFFMREELFQGIMIGRMGLP
jgi:hypothetical protein